MKPYRQYLTDSVLTNLSSRRDALTVRSETTPTLKPEIDKVVGKLDAKIDEIHGRVQTHRNLIQWHQDALRQLEPKKKSLESVELPHVANVDLGEFDPAKHTDFLDSLDRFHKDAIRHHSETISKLIVDNKS